MVGWTESGHLKRAISEIFWGNEQIQHYMYQSANITKMIWTVNRSTPETQLRDSIWGKLAFVVKTGFDIFNCDCKSDQSILWRDDNLLLQHVVWERNSKEVDREVDKEVDRVTNSPTSSQTAKLLHTNPSPSRNREVLGEFLKARLVQIQIHMLVLVALREHFRLETQKFEYSEDSYWPSDHMQQKCGVK